jgi:hypothetical protein
VMHYEYKMGLMYHLGVGYYLGQGLLFSESDASLARAKAITVQ